MENLKKTTTKKLNKSYKKAKFISIWDGDIEITTNCKVNLKTKKVYDIKTLNVDVNTLDGEYIEINKERYPVYPISNLDPENIDDHNKYWYNE